MTCKTSYKAQIQSRPSKYNGQLYLYDPRIAFAGYDEAEEKCKSFGFNYSATLLIGYNSEGLGN